MFRDPTVYQNCIAQWGHMISQTFKARGCEKLSDEKLIAINRLP